MKNAFPRVNLVVIRSTDIDRAVEFYKKIGLTFEKHSHGKGPEHYASEHNGFVFEIYPVSSSRSQTKVTRIGFQVCALDVTFKRLRKIGAEIVSLPKDSEWGRRAVVKDFDGHTVELLEK